MSDEMDDYRLDDFDGMKTNTVQKKSKRNKRVKKEYIFKIKWKKFTKLLKEANRKSHI